MPVGHQTMTVDLDDVLLAFMRSCPNPDMDDVKTWQGRYPQFADDILENAWETKRHLASGVDLSRLENEPGDEALAALLIQRASDRRSSPRGEDLGMMIEGSGSSPGVIESAMGFEGEFLEAAVDGELALPVPIAIVEALSSVIGRSVDAVMAAFERSARMRSAVHMSARSAQPPRQTTYAELIASTDMPEERKAFWLREQ